MHSAQNNADIKAPGAQHAGRVTEFTIRSVGFNELCRYMYPVRYGKLKVNHLLASVKNLDRLHLRLRCYFYEGNHSVEQMVVFIRTLRDGLLKDGE